MILTRLHFELKQQVNGQTASLGGVWGHEKLRLLPHPQQKILTLVYDINSGLTLRYCTTAICFATSSACPGAWVSAAPLSSSLSAACPSPSPSADSGGSRERSLVSSAASLDWNSSSSS